MEIPRTCQSHYRKNNKAWTEQASRNWSLKEGVITAVRRRKVDRHPRRVCITNPVPAKKEEKNGIKLATNLLLQFLLYSVLSKICQEISGLKSP
jgi:hypothetical protein